MTEHSLTPEQVAAYGLWLRREEHAPGTVEKYLRDIRAFSSLRIKKQGEVKNFCRSHPAGPRRIGLAQSSGKSTLPTKE